MATQTDTRPVRPTPGLPAAPAGAPTRRHRPAVWEAMLGTVYAMNAAREVRYFDYDHAAAVEFAGLGDDVRWGKRPKAWGPCRWARSGATEAEPGFKLALWTIDPKPGRR